MNVKEFARLGGKARAKALSQQRRIEIARNAGIASAKKRNLQACSDNHAISQPNEEIPENKVESISGHASK